MVSREVTEPGSGRPTALAVEPDAECGAAAPGGTPGDGAAGIEGTAGPRAGLRVRSRRLVPDAAAYLCYLALAVWTCGEMWINPTRRISAHLANDNVLFYWWLTHGAYSVRHLTNPLFTAQMNVPDGVNVMANTAVLGVSIPLAPITMWLGPAVSYDVYLTLALAASAGAAYHVFSRYLVRSRVAAFIGAGFFGFAPGIIHHANGQPNFVSNFLLPFIVLRVFRLREPGRVLRNGVVLGLLVVWQVFINEELLLLTALGCLAAVLIWAALNRSVARAAGGTFLRAGLVAVAVAVPLLAYPIWFQFYGPQHYQGVPNAFSDWGEDLTAYVTFSRDTLAGDAAVEKTIGLSEQNSWFGAPLVILLAITIALLWRRSPVARVTTWVMVPFFLLAIGPMVRFDGVKTVIPGPWRLIQNVPLIRFMYPSRMVYVLIGCVAVLLAVACDVLPRLSLPGSPVPFRVLWYALVAIALVPIVPTPMPGMDAPAVPRFITKGDYRAYLDDRHTLLAVPPPDNTIGMPALLWQAVDQERYRTARGYFLGPNRDGTGTFGAPARPTQDLFFQIWMSEALPDVTDTMRRQAVEDLRYWRAAIVVIDVHDPRVTLWRVIMTELLGFPPRLVDGVWLWDVRSITEAVPR